ncbi:MAG: DUF1616 domain-containing protein [Candidatus Bathyarchaeota archaeon]
MRIDEKIQGAVILALLAYAALTVAPIILGDRIVEPFSELGVLGPGMKLGGYPREVEAGEDMSLYLYLGNHERRPTYYQVQVKLGDRSMNVSDSESYPGAVLSSYRHVLDNEANYTRSIVISVKEPGLNRRLVFELQKYSPDEGRFVYDGVWVQLWLNVTEPS